MALTAGTRFGPYEIVSPLGAGGMGEVYRARDTALNRDVAVKVLPESFAKDPNRLARFRREAQNLAAVNHPHIAQIFSLETHNDSNGREQSCIIVMELVEGEDLSQVIARGPLPPQEAFVIAQQIAEALSAAHEQAIVHRDLKPANIRRRTDGTVKVLDFGLAKTAGPPDTTNHAMNSAPTLTVPAETMHGMILGTASYMSPEQAGGKTADRRSDLWAFGVILFEMLSGQRLFTGETVTEVLASVLKSDPDWGLLPGNIPAAIRKLLHRCLEKDRRRRLDSAADARLEIEDALTQQPDHTGLATAKTGRPGLVRRALPLVAALMLGATAAGMVAWRTRRVEAPSAPRVDASLVVPADLTIGGPATAVSPARILSVSPDGSHLAFTAAPRGGRLSIWIRPLDSLVARPLAGTEGAQYPFWSPDGRFLAFWSDGKLWRAELSGGTPTVICEIGPNITGGTWNRDDVILFGLNTPGVIQRVSASGGSPQPATTLDVTKGETRHFAPWFLPDGEHFLFLALGSRDGGESAPNGVFAASLGSTARVRILSGGSNVQYAQGALFFLREKTLFAQHFDVERLTLEGDPIHIADGIQIGGPGGTRGAFSVSASGVLAYLGQPGIGLTTDMQLTWFDRETKVQTKLGEPAGYYGDLELAPNDTRALAGLTTITAGSSSVWSIDTRDGTRVPFSFEAGRNPIWAPDESRAVYSHLSEDGQHADIVEKLANGTGPSHPVLEQEGVSFATSWSRDGRALLFQRRSGKLGSEYDIATVSMTGDRKSAAWLATPFSEHSARFSPDARWVAYVSNESGREEVYVGSFPQTGAKWRVSINGGSHPRWNPNGTELFFLAPDSTLMVSAVDGIGAAFKSQPAQPLFVTYAPMERTPYSVSADGKRILLLTFANDAATSSITVVVNWASRFQSESRQISVR